MDEKKKVYVTCKNDYWNSADGSGFFLIKGQVKELPEFTTPIVEDALEQGLLIEATKEELAKFLKEQQIEQYIRDGKIKSGNTYKETVENYEKYQSKIIPISEQPKDKPEFKPGESVGKVKDPFDEA